MNLKQACIQKFITTNFLKKILILLLIFQFSLSDTCSFNNDGTGLMNIYHQLYVNDNCYPCMNQCRICNNISDMSCAAGNCEDFFYFDSQYSQCLRCTSLCKNCKGPAQKDCQVCVEEFYFDNNAKICKPCPYGAKHCSGMIVQSCKQKYFLDPQSFSCRKCSANCLNCTSQSSCTLCVEGYFIGQNNYCQKCQIQFCSQCSNLTQCNQCLVGYKLNTSSMTCEKNTCTQQSCLNCSPSNQNICTLCKDGYFLFETKCYFGSSILCKTGLNGSSYGKCQQCIQQLSFTNQNNPSFCLLNQPKVKDYQFEFKSYSQVFLCKSPEFLTQKGMKLNKIQIDMEPMFQLNFDVRFISQLKNSSFLSVNLKAVDMISSFGQIGDFQIKSQSFYCKTPGSVTNTAQLFTYRIKKSFYIDSLQNMTILTIEDTSNTSLIYLSQILITRYKCLIENCISCYSSSLCSKCQNDYFLEQYLCKKNCSDGYYSNFYERKCVQQCSQGFYLVFEQSICQKCPQQCLTCTNINSCTKCNAGFFLQIDKCLKECPDNHTYPDITTNQCKKCKNPCKTCQNTKQNCTSCLQGYLFQNKCLSYCPISYFSNFLNSSAVCSACSPNCKTCTIDKDFCQTCHQDKSFHEGQCLNECPQGFYSALFGLQQKVCRACLSSCKNCIGVEYNCTSCSNGFSLRISSLEYSTLIKQFTNKQIKMMGTIFQIDMEPKSTSNLSSQTLNNTYYAGLCISACPLVYFYENEVNKSCQKCQKGCLKCGNLTNCIECQTGHFLQNGICVVSCMSTNRYMEKSTKTCELCKIPCKDCLNDYQGTSCVSCFDGYFQYAEQKNQTSLRCVLRCPIGYYKNTAMKAQCLKCPQNCSQCLAFQYCTDCKEGFYLTVDGQCTSSPSCQIGYFFQPSTRSCSHCLQTCLSCEKTSYFCTECQDQKLYLTISDGLCVQECFQGYYPNKINRTELSNLDPNTDRQLVLVCQKCNQKCSACINDSVCTKCYDEFVIHNQQCLQNCPLAYFETLDLNGKICLSCAKKCQHCTSQRCCLQCQQNYILYENQCLQSCFEGFYSHTTITKDNLTVSQCLPCSEKCQKCTTQLNCTACLFGFFLSYNQELQIFQCKNECDDGFYQNKISRACQPCQYPCKNCQNSHVCLSCQQNLNLISQNCVDKCPFNFYLKYLSKTTSQFTCLPCIFPCKTCQSQSKCLECSSGYFFYQQSFSCMKECPDGFYGNNLTNKCQLCQKPCKTCGTNANQCKSCIFGYNFRNDFCLSICPTGTYLNPYEDNQTLCTDCSFQCTKCKSLDFCTECRSQYFLYQEHEQSQSQKCIKNCPMGFYAEQKFKRCEKCYQKCKTCIKDKFSCTSCYENQFLLRNSCVQKCPNFYFTQIKNFTCQQCKKWCKQCANQSTCLQCATGYLYQGECLSTCPQRFYENKQLLRCSPCMQGCLKCKSDKFCQKCSRQENFILFQSICIKDSCPEGYYQFVDDNECTQSCNFLLNEKQKKCYKRQCPQNLILSKSGRNCQQSCQSYQFVSYGSKQNSTIIQCENEQVLRNANIDTEELPQFAVDIIPTYDMIGVFVKFSFNAFENVAASQLGKYFSISVKTINSLDRIFWQVQSWKRRQIQLRLLLSQSQAQNDTLKKVGFQVVKTSVNKNTAAFWLDINTESLAYQNRHKLAQNLLLTIKMLNPYREFPTQLNGYVMPLQNYKKQLNFQYLNYDQPKAKSIVTQVIIIIFTVFIVAIIIATLVLFRNQQQHKLYIFGSVIDYFQMFFILTFVSVNLPPGLEGLFLYCKFLFGHLVFSNVFGGLLDENVDQQLMHSPWQFYKYSGDVNLFRNLSDVLFVVGLWGFIVMVSVLLNKFTKKCRSSRILKMIRKKKLIVFEYLGWFFMPIVGLYGLINVFYGTQTDKYSNELQQSVIYKIIAYLISVVFFLSPVYFFYHQFTNKIVFDKGLDEKKKRLGVGIPLYRFVRKFLLVFFITCYWQNSIYALCIFTLSTAVVFIMVYWFQPYNNPIRQIISTIEQFSLLILFVQITILFLNIQFYSWLSVIIIIHTVLHGVLLLVYPCYRIYLFVRYKEDVQISIRDDGGEKGGNAIGNSEDYNNKGQDNEQQQSVTEKQQQQLRNQLIGKQKQTKKLQQEQTKVALKTILRKKVRPNMIDSEFQANQADQSEQGKVVKKAPVNNVVRLAKKQTKAVRRFKNYDFSSQQQENEENEQNAKK